jgi:ribosomal protein L24E
VEIAKGIKQNQNHPEKVLEERGKGNLEVRPDLLPGSGNMFVHQEGGLLCDQTTKTNK